MIILLLVGALLLLAVLVVAGCLAGMALLSDPFDRLHFLAPTTTLAPVAVLAAVGVQHGWSALTARTALVVALIVITGPVLTHATARSVLTRPGDDVEERDWTVTG